MNLSDAKILITGASGSLGKQLLYELDRLGVRPVAHLRSTSDTSFIDSLGLEKRPADLRVANDMDRVVEGVDAVVHTAAWVNFRRDRLTQFTGINTFAAVRLFKAAQAAGVKRFVQVSTVATIGAIPRAHNHEGPRRTQPLRADERFTFNLDHLRIPYIMTKRAAETELLKLASAGTTELVIVNPSIMVAPSRTGDDYGKTKKSFRPIMPSFANRINLVDIRDVAPGIISALRKGRRGERYILAGDDIAARDLLLDVSSIVGVMPHLISVPRRLVNWAARFSLWFKTVFGGSKISFYPDLVRLLDYDWAYSSMKARAELGYRNRSLHITLEDLLTNSFTGCYQKPAG